MKKKLLVVLFALISVFCFAFGLSACGGGSKAQQIEIGDTKSKVEKLLGLPDEESSGKWEYYGSDYTKLLKQEEEIAEKMFSAKNDSELEKYAKQLEEIENKLLNMEYPYTVVYFDNNKVSSVIFDAKHSEEGGGEKEVKKIQLSSDTVPLFSDIRSSGIYVKITYTDGSYKNTPIENADSFDSSSSGTKTVEWSDEWGKYSAKVTVGNVIKKDMSFSGKFGENRFIATALDTGTLDNVKFSVTFEILSSDGVLARNYGKWESIKEQVAEITIPDGVTGIGNYTFEYCSALTSLTVNDGVTSIGESAFSRCTSLKNITLPDSVTRIGESAFEDCPVETATIPAVACKYVNNPVLKTAVIVGGRIEDEAFKDCTSLTSVTISDDIESVGKDAFEGCVGLRFNEHENISYLGNGENPHLVLVKVKDKSLNSYTLHEKTRVIASYAFMDCTSLTSIEIRDGVKGIGAYAFSGCTSLTDVTVADSVTVIGGYVFENCPIETATIPAAACRIVRNPSLRTLVITSGESIVYYRYGGMFEDCANLVSVTIPKSVTRIDGSTFSGCKSLIIYCEADSKPSGWAVTWNSYPCPVIWNCKNNDKDSDGNAYAEIGGIIYSLKDGVANVVGQPVNITDANIPATVTYKNESFNVTGIADRAFRNCAMITSITVPDSVTGIGNSAFYGCSKLKDINFNGTVAQWKAIKKNSGWDSDTGDYTVHCTDGDLSKSES